MDLHEKLALRRKEREIETSAALAKIAVHEAAKTAALQHAARKQLAEEGFPVIDGPSTTQSIQGQKNKVIERLALARMVFWEIALCTILTITGVVSLFGSTFTGILFLVGAGWFLHSRIEKYKGIIIMESASIVEAKALLKDI